MDIAKYIDHTNLNPTASESDIEKLCQEAKEFHFASVCVNPVNVKLAKSFLEESDVKIACVVGFPLGENTTMIKEIEAKMAVVDGADEIDMVLSISRLVAGDFDYVYNDIFEVVHSCKATVKVIFETCKLNAEQIIKATDICIKAGAKFIKTSTGFLGEGATEVNVKIMKGASDGKIEIKASGGIKTYADAVKMIEAGATRIGTSNGVKIVNEQVND
ncbi:MAG: deoxyribose-phosphate aldolase [Clostridia bacterium]